MNFATVPTIHSSIIERAQKPHFGYFFVRDEYYDSIIQWHKVETILIYKEKSILVMKMVFLEELNHFKYFMFKRR